MTPAPPAQRGRRLPSWLVGTGVIAIAMAVMNVTTYGFTILAARMLGPAQYGALAAIMGVMLVVNVVSLGLQATGARRVSTSTGDIEYLEHDVMSASYWSAGALGLLMLAASPVVASVLNLDSWLTAALVAVTAVPLTVMGGQAGILQGERRWGPLAGIYLGVGVGRLAFGALALVVSRTALAGTLGVTIGSVVPVIIGWYALRHPSRRRTTEARAPREHPARWARGGVLRETVGNSQALLAFFALSNADVIIARSTLPEHQAGLYAGGLILAKAVLFLPQFVVVIAFPSMSERPDARRMHLASLAMVLGIGGVTVVGTAVLSTLAVVFIGGPEYADLQDRLWLFAVLGTLLSLLQLLVYNVVARQHQRAVLLVWAALLGLVAAGPFLATLDELLAVVLTIDSALFLALLVVSLRPARTPVPVAPAA
ncbi:MAG: lipopolysaccharide biosynthesis protein [Oryzihumus sp.]